MQIITKGGSHNNEMHMTFSFKIEPAQWIGLDRMYQNVINAFLMLNWVQLPLLIRDIRLHFHLRTSCQFVSSSLSRKPAGLDTRTGNVFFFFCFVFSEHCQKFWTYDNALLTHVCFFFFFFCLFFFCFWDV